MVPNATRGNHGHCVRKGSVSSVNNSQLDAGALLSVTYGASPRLAARINTPYGVKTLSS